MSRREYIAPVAPETALDGAPADRLAITVSAVCLLHCLLTPALVLLFPVLGSTIVGDHAAFHGLLLALIVPSSVLAFWLGLKRHRDRRVLALGATGLAVLVLAAVLGPEGLGVTGEKLVTGVGGVVLAAGHVLNFRLCRALSCAATA